MKPRFYIPIMGQNLISGKTAEQTFSIYQRKLNSNVFTLLTALGWTPEKLEAKFSAIDPDSAKDFLKLTAACIAGSYKAGRRINLKTIKNSKGFSGLGFDDWAEPYQEGKEPGLKWTDKEKEWMEKTAHIKIESTDKMIDAALPADDLPSLDDAPDMNSFPTEDLGGEVEEISLDDLEKDMF
jgi:hypothetical protein